MLTAFSQTGNEVTACFSDDSSVSADLLVGADGFRSAVRQHCLPELAPRYAGYVAWRALLEARDIPSGASRELLDCMSFGLPPGEQFLGYPVAAPYGDPQAERCYNVVWYRPADEETELSELLTDEDGNLHELSIPPTLIRRRVVLGMRSAAEKLLGPPFREIVRLIEEPLLQPVYDLDAPQMAFGRVAIVGDAACVARPHVAAGVAKAAEDGIAICEALARESDVATALKSFEAARRPVNRRIVERARHLGAYLQATQTAEEAVRSRYHSVPEAVLAETALLDFLE
jgi:2-polyprenyl-6-methoxyphenol hydroxylase-like FAD-dependent oxidoreductase